MLTLSAFRGRRQNGVKANNVYYDGTDDSTSYSPSSFAPASPVGRSSSERYNTVHSNNITHDFSPQKPQSTPQSRRASYIASHPIVSPSVKASRRMSTPSLQHQSSISAINPPRSFSRSYTSLADKDDVYAGSRTLQRPLSTINMSNRPYNAAKELPLSPAIDPYFNSSAHRQQQSKPQSYLSRKLSLLVGH